ncbi:MAG: DUF2141 domain-containing protein [Bacteroidetes bacterium]|nr:DUF2141 domain-containing protein [Bacteroidota bacterium]
MKRTALLIIILSLSLQSSPAQGKQSMTISINGLREAKGQVMVFVYNNADDFPTKRDKAFRAKKVPVTGAAIEVTFDDVPDGTYGVAVYHDENMNDKMDRSWYGMPKEGYGASNDAKGSFGPPSFDDAKFTFPAATKSIPIIIHY